MFPEKNILKYIADIRTYFYDCKSTLHVVLVLNNPFFFIPYISALRRKIVVNELYNPILWCFIQNFTILLLLKESKKTLFHQ